MRIIHTMPNKIIFYHSKKSGSSFCRIHNDKNRDIIINENYKYRHNSSMGYKAINSKKIMSQAIKFGGQQRIIQIDESCF